MTTCADFRQFVTAYVDGEIVGEDRGVLESHFATCPACRRLLDDERAMSALLHSSHQAPEAPSALRERVHTLLSPKRILRPVPWLVLAVFVVGVALTGAFLARGRASSNVPGETSELATLAADTHLRYSRGQLPLEVRTERPQQLSSFFSGRVPFHLTIPDYQVGPGEQKFYRLEGGRLVSFHNDYAAYVAYRMDTEPVSLLVTTAAHVPPRRAEAVRSGRLTFYIEAVAGLQVITWSDKGLTYALASDVAVSGERSCMVCHGSPEERERVRGFPGRPHA